LSDTLDQSFDAALNGSCVVACSNAGNDDLVDNSRSSEIADVAFESISHFDPKAAIFRHDEQRQAIVESLAAHTPFFECPCRPVFNGNAAGC